MPPTQSDSAPPYDEGFYAEQAPGSERSARVVLPIVLALLEPASIMDVGCGIGTWLRVARDLGVASVRGYDGAYARASGLLIDESEFIAVDLNESLPRSDAQADLAICLEVAEHLPDQRGVELVAWLCQRADAVLFSAAIPGQLGTSHISLHPQSRWANLFAAHGYEVFDVVRPQVWDCRDVEVWYRQNVLLYVNRSRVDLCARARAVVVARKGVLDAVHPELAAFWERRATREVSLAQSFRLVGRAVRRAFGRRIALGARGRTAS